MGGLRRRPASTWPASPTGLPAKPRTAVQMLRWQADAAMVGIDTVVADDPLLTDRSSLPRRRPLLRVVLDSALRMPLDSKLVKTAKNDVMIFTVSDNEARIRELTAGGIRVEVLPAEAVARVKGLRRRDGNRAAYRSTRFWTALGPRTSLRC